MLGSRSPAAVLLLLAPVVGGLLNGATRISFLFALVPQILVWGCGTLLIREAAHRWRGRTTSILALAVGLSIWVEFFVLQTSRAPLPWLRVAHDRVWGVNWLWLAFMLGYESVWIVLVPILITELIFAERRHEAWLGPRGLAAAALGLVLGSWMLWGLWTRVAMIALAFAPYPPIPLWLALLAGCSWAATAFFVMRRWTRGHGWSDRQRWALAFGALLTCMMAGFLGSSFWPPIDLVGKAALNTIAIALMVILARSVWRRDVPA